MKTIVPLIIECVRVLYLIENKHGNINYNGLSDI